MSVKILGVRIDHLRIAEVKERCAEWLSQKERQRLRQVVTVNPEFIMEAQGNAEFQEVLNTAALSLADGVGLFFASWLLYGWRSRLLRVTGVDFTWMLAELCAQKGSRFYLLGAGEGVAARTAEVLKKKFPTLVIAGAEMGIPKIVSKTSDLFDKELCEKICEARPDVLLVAFGAPRQDLWIAQNASRLKGAAIAVGVGGTFDYLAGAVPYAPKWVRSIGFEWTYRLMTQPYRWRRIMTAVIKFPIAVLRKKLFS